MIFENRKLVDSLFGQFNLSQYVSEHNIAQLVGVDLAAYGEVEKKAVQDPYHSVNPDLNETFSPELDDLGRLHWLVTTRHVTTILEFGLGKSTIVFNNALATECADYLSDNFKRKPKIGILGLNPHNAEMRKNSEEKKIIIPAISKLRKLGFLIKGPLVADTVFIKDFKNYDILIGMYHDQVLTPFKTIFTFDAINITLGLKYLRVSPDHGVAKNLILKNKANPLSLIKCIEFVNKA